MVKGIFADPFPEERDGGVERSASMVVAKRPKRGAKIRALTARIFFFTHRHGERDAPRERIRLFRQVSWIDQKVKRLPHEREGVRNLAGRENGVGPEERANDEEEER